MRRFFYPVLAVAVVMTALLGGADRASAAIRITISDGSNPDQVFYSPNSNGIGFFTTLGAYQLSGSALSNFPGQAVGGTLSQTLAVNDGPAGPGTLPTLTVSADIIDSVGSLGAGQVFGGDLVAVSNASLLRFTQPDAGILMVSSSITSLGGGPSATGTVQNNTSVNGSLVGSAVTVGAGSNEQSGLVGNTPSGYTLSSEIVLSGANQGISGLTISAASRVTAHSPEPGSLAVWGLGALGLAFAGAARRRFQRPQA